MHEPDFRTSGVPTVYVRGRADVSQRSKRTGQNLNETTLTTANVNSSTFGKLFSRHLDGFVYAQPLYESGVSIPRKGVHNVVFVATEHDSVYAFDADSNTGSNRNPLWRRSFLGHGVRTVPSRDTLTTDLVPEVGITGTPVIDPATGTMYVVVKTKEGSGKTVHYVQRLHALDITTGAEKLGGPVVIQATVPGTGDGNDGNGNVAFDPLREAQRAALTLVNGVVYVAWASHGDNGPYHGWVMGYDATTLQQVAVFNDTPNGGLGGIWMSGGGLSSDGNGNLFLATGNGTFDSSGDLGDSILRLSTANGLTVADSFTPANEATLAAQDNDLGSGGPLLLPDQPGATPHELLVGGKDGTLWLANRDQLGGFNSAVNQVVQQISGSPGGYFDTPSYFNGNVYVHAPGDSLSQYTLSNGQLPATPTATAPGQFGFPGATASISANGTDNGIVWEIEIAKIGILHAYDATNVSNELYNSDQIGKDKLGPGVKFSVPTVANGKVFVGTSSTLSVFGLRAKPIIAKH